jgi:hypothetical protein
MRVSMPAFTAPRLTPSSRTPLINRDNSLIAILALLRGRQGLGIAQHGKELAAAAEEYEGAPHDRRDLFTHRVASGQRHANFALQFGESADHRRGVQLFLRSELPVNAAFADAGACRHFIDQHEFEFPLGEEFCRTL